MSFLTSELTNFLASVDLRVILSDSIVLSWEDAEVGLTLLLSVDSDLLTDFVLSPSMLSISPSSVAGETVLSAADCVDLLDFFSADLVTTVCITFPSSVGFVSSIVAVDTSSVLVSPVGITEGILEEKGVAVGLTLSASVFVLSPPMLSISPSSVAVAGDTVLFTADLVESLDDLVFLSSVGSLVTDWSVAVLIVPEPLMLSNVFIET